MFTPPSPSVESLPFWRSGADGVLRVQRCEACRYWSQPPAPRCPRCRSLAVGFEPVSGRAVVHSFTVNHQRWDPSVEVPYTIALVELIEQDGLRLLANLVAVRPDDVEIGMEVAVSFVPAGGVHVPVFAPLERSRRR